MDSKNKESKCQAPNKQTKHNKQTIKTPTKPTTTKAITTFG